MWMWVWVEWWWCGGVACFKHAVVLKAHTRGRFQNTRGDVLSAYTSRSTRKTTQHTTPHTPQHTPSTHQNRGSTRTTSSTTSTADENLRNWRGSRSSPDGLDDTSLILGDSNVSKSRYSMQHDGKELVFGEVCLFRNHDADDAKLQFDGLARVFVGKNDRTLLKLERFLQTSLFGMSISFAFAFR